MASMEWECSSCKHNWFNNKADEPCCPACGSQYLVSWSDEGRDYGTQDSESAEHTAFEGYND